VTSYQFILLQENQQERKVNQATTTGTTLKVGKFKDNTLHSEKNFGNFILNSVVKTGSSVSSRAMNKVLPTTRTFFKTQKDLLITLVVPHGHCSPVSIFPVL